MEPSFRILLVEDHGATRETVRQALLEAGYTVHTARDGARALALMSTERPQIVILDLMLPDIDGVALARKLRSLADGTPLRMVAFSGLVSDAEAQRITELGFDDVVPKPVFPTRLVQVVRAQCEALTLLQSTLQSLHELSDPLAPRAPSRPPPSNSQDGEGELMRRCSALSAELTVWRAISQAVMKEGDADGELVAALSTCIDAGQGAFGALYLRDDEQLRVRVIGNERGVHVSALAGFFGQEGWLRAAIQGGQLRVLGDAEPEVRAALKAAGVHHAVVAPLRYEGRALGALFMAQNGGDRNFLRYAHGLAEQVAQALALAQAFSARVKAEREGEQQRRLARDQAAMWRALVDGAPDVVMHLDVKGNVRFINRTPERVRSARALSWFDMVEEVHHGEMRAALASVFAAGASHTLELCSVSEAELPIWTENHLGPVRSGTGVSGALVIQRDVSEKKAAEAQLFMTDRMDSVGDLAAAIAHEVNNPLTSVIANLELALQEAEQLKTPGELLDELHDAREAATRVRTIVRDLDVFSRAGDDSRALVDLEHVLDSALRLAWNEIRSRATLRRELHDAPRVWGNQSRLGQALLSLILHMVHGIEEGNPEHNSISVDLYADELEHVVIVLRDSGRPLSEGAKASLLQPFSSVRPAASALGLSICQRVIAEHGGTITIESGEHNELRVVLPACAQAELESHTDPRDSEVRALRRGCVLVVDDERLITQVVRRTLTRDHDVVTLDNAAEALRRLEAGERFDAIVCDLMMPGLTGMDFHARVLRDFPDLADKIVFFTGGAFTPRAREFLRSVPNQRVDKPVAGYELRQVINALVR
jgi:CheY-like chemotaxis protein/nitrogen-specific signal transduction histidine kinase